MTLTQSIKVLDITTILQEPIYQQRITHKEYEDNEARRKIKVIRPEFIRRVVSEFERIMSV